MKFKIINIPEGESVYSVVDFQIKGYYINPSLSTAISHENTTVTITRIGKFTRNSIHCDNIQKLPFYQLRHLRDGVSKIIFNTSSNITLELKYNEIKYDSDCELTRKIKKFYQSCMSRKFDRFIESIMDMYVLNNYLIIDNVTQQSFDDVCNVFGSSIPSQLNYMKHYANICNSRIYKPGRNIPRASDMIGSVIITSHDETICTILGNGNVLGAFNVNSGCHKYPLTVLHHLLQFTDVKLEFETTESIDSIQYCGFITENLFWNSMSTKYEHVIVKNHGFQIHERGAITKLENVDNDLFNLLHQSEKLEHVVGIRKIKASDFTGSVFF